MTVVIGIFEHRYFSFSRIWSLVCDTRELFKPVVLAQYILLTRPAHEIKDRSKSSLARNEDWSRLTTRHGKKPRISFVHCRFASPSSCLFSLPGIWPDGADGTDVNSVDRSNGKQFVATGDDFGNVNLYRYPCVIEKVRIYPPFFRCQVVLLLSVG